MKDVCIRLLIVVFAFCNCHSTKTTSKQPVNLTLRILFVGNSLTYTNDLPFLLKELAEQDLVDITYTAFLLPNYALEDHLNKGIIQREIETGNYDVVVAQQGPSALPESQVLLMRDAKILADLCKKSGHTRLALYMVWPSISRSFDLDNVIYSYTQAAQQTESLLCPAGLAWKYAPDLPLYSPDNFHPSLAGSVLAAFTIYGALKDKKDFSFVQYNHISWKSAISEAQFEKMKEAALKALKK